MTDLIVAIIASYLIGSTPGSYLIGRAKGVDLRLVGSGNVGATNAGRTLGRPYGILAFVVDFLKGVIPATLLVTWAMDRGNIDWTIDELRVTFGAAAIVGHIFPVWLGFRGGKGVATSAGVCAAIHLPALVVALLVWLAVVKGTRYMSLASMSGAVAFPLAFFLLAGPTVALGERLLVTSLALFLALAILILHRSNIGRLRRGEELRVGGSQPK